jgi:DNA-binding NarL/FixJ family response regulator
MAITTLVVEDDPLSRLMLRSTLSDGGLAVVAVGRADAGLAVASEHSIVVAILNVRLGAGLTGLKLAQELRRRQPDADLIMLTSLLGPRLVADGIVELPARARHLPKSAVMSVAMLLGIVREVLTEAQIATLRLVADGLSNAEIAAPRSISARTVEKEVQRMACMLGLCADAARNQRGHLARVYFRGFGGHAGPDGGGPQAEADGAGRAGVASWLAGATPRPTLGWSMRPGRRPDGPAPRTSPAHPRVPRDGGRTPSGSSARRGRRHG